MSYQQVEPTQNQSSGDGLVYLSRSALIALRQSGENLLIKRSSIASQQAGAYLSRFKGRGMEFDEARQYQPGDDIRTLDWRVTARTGIAHTKLFREERERPVITWVDMRSSMQFATRGAFKSVIAAKAAALVAWRANKQGDRLGGMIFSDQEHHELRPQQGKSATLHLIKQLSATSQLQQTTSKLQDATSALARLRRVARPGSLIFLFSDFRNLGNQAEAHIAQLARHNDIVLFHIFDPLERDLPADGQYNIYWQQKFSVFNSNSQSREEHQQQFEQHLQMIDRMGRYPSVHVAHCATDDDLLQKLRSSMKAKRS